MKPKLTSLKAILEVGVAMGMAEAASRDAPELNACPGAKERIGLLSLATLV